MSFVVPKGWTRENDTLFIHTSDVRIQRMTYRGNDGWYIVPVDLDQALIRFEPTSEGQEKAFEAYANNALKEKPKVKAAPKKGKPKAAKAPVAEEEPEEKDIESEEDDEAEEGEKEEGAGESGEPG